MTFRVRFYVCFGPETETAYTPIRFSWDTHPFGYSPKIRLNDFREQYRVGGRTISRNNNNNNNGSCSGGIANGTRNVCQYTAAAAAVDVAAANNVIYFVFGDISVFVYQFVFCIQFSFHNRTPHGGQSARVRRNPNAFHLF